MVPHTVAVMSTDLVQLRIGLQGASQKRHVQASPKGTPSRLGETFSSTTLRSKECAVRFGGAHGVGSGVRADP